MRETQSHLYWKTVQKRFKSWFENAETFELQGFATLANKDGVQEAGGSNPLTQTQEVIERSLLFLRFGAIFARFGDCFYHISHPIPLQSSFRFIVPDSAETELYAFSRIFTSKNGSKTVQNGSKTVQAEMPEFPDFSTLCDIYAASLMASHASCSFVSLL